ncbi:MAG: hypothetical protein ABI444_11660 [Candidatus Kapaibacterium sp.]|jgi:ribosome maturation factor RimP
MDAEFKSKIAKVVGPLAIEAAKARGLVLLRTEVRGAAQAPVIEIVLDGDRPVLIEDCEAISRHVNTVCEEGSLIKGNFRLDVLSPGTDEPLVHDYQFKRNIGRVVEAHYTDGEETHTVHGKLHGFAADEIELEPLDLMHKARGRRQMVKPEPQIEPDEQIYLEPVELVQIDRSKLLKVLVQPEFSSR